MDADITATFAIDDDTCTEQMPALTVEQTLFDEPLPIPPPLHGDPAYLVEVRAPHRAPSLLGVRASLDEAFALAASIHAAVADVTIRELSLPCDAESLVRVLSSHRTWTRSAAGAWDEPTQCS